MSAAIVFADVVMRYREGAGERSVLTGASATLPLATSAALLGRSGSGKSTLLNLAAGTELASAGQVVVLGQDLGRLGDRGRTLLRRRRLGVVYQHFNLLPTLTVAEQLLLRLQLVGRRGAPARERAGAMLAAVGLADRADSFPDRLSGGEQQRVAVAAALVHDPDLVLADEPTGSLDRINAELVLDLLIDLVRSRGASLLIATHDPTVAERTLLRWQLDGGCLTTC